MSIDVKELHSTVRGISPEEETPEGTTAIWRKEQNGGQLTVTKESSGDVNITYFVEDQSGAQVTLEAQDDLRGALIQRPNGDTRFYRLQSGPDGLQVSYALGDVRAGGEEEDLALIKSARILFDSAIETNKGFEGFRRINPFDRER